jgi:hypothetical protein
VADPVLRWPGSKWRLSDWIIQHMPPHEVYLEPFFGSGAVFFNKMPSDTETINDLDGNVVNLFRVIREHSEELAALIDMTPWSREEYNSGRTCLRGYKKLGPVGLLARMLLDTSHWGSTVCYLTWKVKVTPHNRLLFQLQASEQSIEGTGYLQWATPNAADAVGSHGGGQSRSLRTDIYNWKRGMCPTPHAMCYKTPCQHGEGGANLQTAIGGQLNSTWVEWLMGFPEGWTDLNA